VRQLVAEREKMAERRQHERLEIKGKALASYRTHSPKVAEIIDISQQGLAFSYVGSTESPNSSFEIDILFPDRTQRQVLALEQDDAVCSLVRLLITRETRLIV
jgi:hypothetical protein